MLNLHHGASGAGDVGAAVEAYHRLARSCLRQLDPRPAVLALSFYRKALDLDPRRVDSYLGLGEAHRRLGQTPEALACADQALALDPDSWAARFHRCAWQIPILYDRRKDVPSRLAAYHDQLEQLEPALARADGQTLGRAADALGAFQPRYLSYQDGDVRDLQARRGELVRRLL